MLKKISAIISSARARTARVMIALVLFFGSLIGWPVSALTFAKDEPQFVLGLSWLAITLTAWDIVTTSQVHEEQDNGGEQG